MSEPITYEGDALNERIPGLFELQGAVHRYVDGLAGDLGAIGDIVPRAPDELSQVIYKTYTKQMGLVDQTFSGLGNAIGVHGLRIRAASDDHAASDDNASDMSESWSPNGHR